MSKRLTAREFVYNENKCPNCGTEVHNWNSFTVESGSARQEATCGECGTRFVAIYRLVGYAMEPGWESVTIKEDFEVTSAEEPVDKVCDELHHADLTIRQLSRIVRKYAKGMAMPPLRNRERSAVLRGKAV